MVMRKEILRSIESKERALNDARHKGALGQREIRAALPTDLATIGLGVFF
jgi:NADH:ubiquinone oxidoreductase subunit F (NADH-binding)